MDKEKLYEKLVSMVPVKSEENKDFRELVSANLSQYMTWVKSLDVNERPSDWDEIKKRIKQLSDGINRAIESEYRGLRHSAFATIKNQLDGYKTSKTEIEGLALKKNIQTIKRGMVSYRMRKVELEEQRNIKRKDLFHIPLDKRGLVQTQRYSVPGYPCLYLAHSVYGCWEEMGRPDFGKVMVSKFVTQFDFKMLDLRVPSKEAWNSDMVRCILIFPFVIASMVQVKNSKDTYKPEYLIPQLLTEWVISKNKENKGNEEVVGIIYTSAQKNEDFSFSDDSFDNYAIPVLKPLGSKKYCKRLVDYFQLTMPTYYDLEVLRNRKAPNEIGLKVDEKGVASIHNIGISPFVKMEFFLKDAELQGVEEGYKINNLKTYYG